MGTAETLASQHAYVYVLFHFHKPAKSFFHRMFMNFEWLLDNDTTFHLAFNQVYFCIGSALERLHSAKHKEGSCPQMIASTGP